MLRRSLWQPSSPRLAAPLCAALLSLSCSHRAPPLDRETRAPAPPAPAAAAPSEPGSQSEDSELTRAEVELEKARAELDRSLASRFAAAPPPPVSTEAAPAKAERPRNSPAPKSAEEAAGAAPRSRREQAPSDAAAPSAEAEGAEKKAENVCERSCKAFASLERAKAAICRLDSPTGQRCSRAEGIVREAQLRVASCACPP